MNLAHPVDAGNNVQILKKRFSTRQLRLAFFIYGLSHKIIQQFDIQLGQKGSSLKHFSFGHYKFSD